MIRGINDQIKELSHAKIFQTKLQEPQKFHTSNIDSISKILKSMRREQAQSRLRVVLKNSYSETFQAIFPKSVPKTPVMGSIFAKAAGPSLPKQEPTAVAFEKIVK